MYDMEKKINFNKNININPFKFSGIKEFYDMRTRSKTRFLLNI